MKTEKLKSTVQLSRWALGVTIVANAILLGACFVTLRQGATFYIILGIYILTLIFAFSFAPTSIEADSASVILHSILKKRRIPYKDIETIRLIQPTMGAIRIAGSGGYMGYWGIYTEGDIGKYTAFYGRSSDCFLVRLKNGTQYMLGCNHPQEMVDFIEYHLKGKSNGQQKP